MGVAPGSTDRIMCKGCRKVMVQNKCKDDVANQHKYRCTLCGTINYAQGIPRGKS